MSFGIIRSLRGSKIADPGELQERVAKLLVVVFWDDKTLEVVESRVWSFLVPYRFKNCEDVVDWSFSVVYSPVKELRERISCTRWGLLKD